VGFEEIGGEMIDIERKIIKSHKQYLKVDSMDLFDLGRVLPSPIARSGARSYITASKSLGRNHYKYQYRDKEFVFKYSNETEFLKLKGVIGDGEGPEGVPMEMLDVDGHDAIIDIGAHFGTYSVIFGVLNPSINLIAFEPNDYNRTVLRTHLRLNGVKASVREDVVSGETGELQFYEDRRATGSIRDTAVPDNESRFTTVTRPSIALSELFNEAEIRAPFVKIDAEGAEQQILPDVLEADLNHLAGIVELHDERLECAPERYLEDLHANGFSTECIKATPSHRRAYHFYPS
jgi:FkbM family methyltransferase